jgi:hypothetical protein
MRRVVKFLPLLVPLLVAAALLVAFLATMGRESPPLAASNSVPLQSLVVQLGRGSNVCQSILAPRGAGVAKLFVAPLDATQGPPMSMRLDDSGRTLRTSRIGGGWTGESVRFPFSTLTATYPAARICVRTKGRPEVRFTGFSNPPSTTTRVNGKHVPAVIGAEFFRPGKTDAWSLLPAIARRAGILKGSLAGAWSFWLAVALVLSGGAIALVVTVRGLRA